MPQCERCGKPLDELSGESVCADCRPSLLRPEIIVPQRLVTQPSMKPTSALVGLSVVVFVMMTVSGASFVEPTALDVIRFGGNFGPLTVSGQYWRMLTAMFVHIGIIHIALNMWVLWGLGRLTETIFAPSDYILLYLTTGLASSTLSLLLHPAIVSAGASGAIFGLAGALLAAIRWGNLPLVPRSRDALFKGVLRFAGINLLFGLVMWRVVDNAGHVGGLLFGLLAGTVLGRRLDDSAGAREYRRFAWMGLLLLALLLAALAVWLRADVARLLHQPSS